MTIDTKRLRELAEKLVNINGLAEENDAAEFIAATDPQTVLALLDEIDRLRTGRDLSIEQTRNSFTGECFERWVTPWEPLPEGSDEDL